MSNHCYCECHCQGAVVFHAFPCCSRCYETYLDERGVLLDGQVPGEIPEPFFKVRKWRTEPTSPA